MRLRCGLLITMEGAPIRDGEVEVERGTVAYSGPWRGDGAGCDLDWTAWTVMPGMVDCHDHLGIDMGDEEAQSREHPAVTTVKALRNARTVLSAGVTTVRNLGEMHGNDVAWRALFADGTVPGPRLVVSGRLITATGGHAWYAGDQADGPTGVRRAVRNRVREGCDLVKIMVTGGVSTAGTDPRAPGYSRAEIEACIEEAHAHGRKVAAHGHGGPAVTWALEAGVDSIEHGAYLTDEQCALMRRTGAYLVVTYGVIEAAAVADDLPTPFREKAAAAMTAYDATLRRAAAAGVNVAVGGDGWHGDPTREAAALVRNGFSAEVAVRALTAGGARLAGLEGRVGTLALGAAADAVAVDGDPLTDVLALGRTRAVMQGGALYTV